MKKLFLAPALVSFAVLAAVYVWGGAGALLLAAALAVLEITLSFDNAVINAKVLAKMSPRWQQRFLTWGMLVSVGGVRLVLPIIIVSSVALVSPIVITAVAFTDPARYAAYIAASGSAIKAFGGSFLLLVALNYFIDSSKSVHWFGRVERQMARWGEVESLEVAIVLALLLCISAIYGGANIVILESGVIGTAIYILAKGISDALSAETAFTRAGAALFAYVSVLDASLSLDGVVGAFAITTALPIIVAGLGIGAYFVRTLTLSMVRGRALERFVYLEHGAHWAIFALAVCMLTGLIIDVPSWLIATVGLFFIILAYASSRREEIHLPVGE